MISEALLTELHNLNRADKLRVVQLLVNELAAQEGAGLRSDTEYMLYTPYGNESAAAILYEVLQQAENRE